MKRNCIIIGDALYVLNNLRAVSIEYLGDSCSMMFYYSDGQTISTSYIPEGEEIMVNKLLEIESIINGD